jgi:hypothetical protein
LAPAPGACTVPGQAWPAGDIARAAFGRPYDAVVFGYLHVKMLDILRHSMRQKPGSNLSPDGIKLARYIGKAPDFYQCVVTSALPRAIQTAVAMGHAVTETVEKLGPVDERIVQQMRWPSDLSTISDILAKCPDCAALAQSQASLWEEIAARLSDEAAGLIVTHGAILELGVVASLGRTNQAIVGEAFAYCEGARLFSAIARANASSS